MSKEIETDEEKTIELNNQETQKEPQTKTKKKKPFIVRLFLGLIKFILIVGIILAGICAFCAIDRKPVLSMIPKDFSFYVKSDSAFKTIDSMLDLRAADVFLSTSEFKGYRSIFMMLRSSELRKNEVFQKIASRQVDAALYDEKILAAIDLGWMSFATRPLKYVYPVIFPKIKPLIQSFLDENALEIAFIDSDEEYPYFEVKSGGVPYYVFPVKNLVMVSDSKEVLRKSVLNENEKDYTDSQSRLLLKSAKELRIVANARKFADSLVGDNQMLLNVAKILPDEELSVINLKISDSDIFIDAKVPVALSKENPSSLDSILEKKSSVPSLLSKLTDVVQYYTMINAGTLEELQKAVFPILPVKNADSLWSKANSACKLAFSMDLSELIFSWTGNELAVLGIENQNDPVFVLQISDEKKRQQVFDKLVSSIFIKEDNSLILDGVRLPRLQLPPFLNGILSMFGVDIPKPYFMVHDGFIYFSESSEALSAVYSNYDSGKALTKTSGWKSASSNLKNEATVSLFYDLEHSVPFFLRSNASLSQVLELYTMGRFDIKLKAGEISISLQANARKSGNLRTVPGFPISVDRSASVKTFVSKECENPEAAFWMENRTLKCLDLASLEISKIDNAGRCELVPAKNIKNAEIWSVSSDGYVSLYDKKLENLPNFPIIISEKIVSGAVSYDDGLIIPLENGSLTLVDSKGATAFIEMPEISIKAQPSVSGDIVAVYDKSFLGSIYFADLKKMECLNPDSPVMVEEIGFGSPGIIHKKDNVFTAFVSQSGLLNIWNDFEEIPFVSKNIDGIFEGNMISSGDYFYVLSTDAVLYRISTNGELLSVKIPNATAKNAYLSVKNVNGKKRVFVNADSNIIYGFNENLELLSGFPLAGSGNPVFSDVDGDKIPEILSISLDKKILAWKMR